MFGSHGFCMRHTFTWNRQEESRRNKANGSNTIQRVPQNFKVESCSLVCPVFELQLTWPCDGQASVLLALQTLDAKYREPLLSELVSMSQELRHGDGEVTEKDENV